LEKWGLDEMHWPRKIVASQVPAAVTRDAIASTAVVTGTGYTSLR